MTVIAKKTHTPKYIYVYIPWNDDEKKYVYNVNLPLGVSTAGLWPKTDHWQTDKTRTVTTMCWVFIFFFLLLLLLYLFLIGIFFSSIVLCWERHGILFRQYFALLVKKRTVYEREKEREKIKVLKYVKINWINLLSFYL